MTDLHPETQQEDAPFCRWQERLHDCGRDITSPELFAYAEMREWEAGWYERNRVR